MSTRATSRLAAWILPHSIASSVLATGLIGCQPSLPDIDAQGQRVAVGIQGDVELCAGTLRAWDAHVEHIEAELGFARDRSDPLEVYLVDDTAPWCDDVMACYIGGLQDATFVPTYAPRAVWHELVHHVVSGSDDGRTDRFLSEGIASALGDDWCPPPGTAWPTPPLSSLLARDEVAYEHYPRAAQWVDWLRAEHGTRALADLVECIDRGDPLDAIDACVQTVLEVDLETLDRQFGAGAPALHGNPALCDGPVVSWDDDGWSWQARLACEDPEVRNTFESSHGRLSDALVEIERPGVYEFVWQSDGDATVILEPCFCQEQVGSIVQTPGSDVVWVGEPGRYRVVLRTSDPITSWVQVWLRALPETEPDAGARHSA